MASAMMRSTTYESASCRAQAEKLREKAATETDQSRRDALIQDAQLWERMADYLEKNQRG